MSSSDYHPALAPLSWLFGVWESIEAEVSYPTMESIKFDEIVEFHPTDQPLLEYKSNTWHSVKKSKLHFENGFIRIDPDSKKVALLVSHFYGAVELSEGFTDGESLCIESILVTQASFITSVAEKVVRKWFLKGEELHSHVFLEANEQPLQKHLVCRYKKIA